ncbi:unnamed protein product [Sphagnum jensenii]|uniref:VDE lipocalin domain-containing protein n=1 Tax=Sphagnum jensenii TaxID=128206 RepID=A0ABP1BIC0_9BRYO
MPPSLGALTQHSRMLRSMKPDVFGAYYNNKQPQNGMMGSMVCRPSSSSVQVNFLSLRIEASVARVNQRKDAISSLEHFLLPTQQQRQQHQLLCTRLSMHGTGISNCSWRATAVKELPMGGWQEAISSFQEVGDDELAYSGWDLFNIHSRQFRQAVVAAVLAAGVFGFLVPSALAVDPLKTCACLLKECRLELAKCIENPQCAANVACLQTCNGRPDETECQIGCGDLFENQVVDEFNDCAVTRKGCVPQKADEGRYPVPPPSALVPNFDTTKFTGQWYISSGLNRTFDTFDCQLHEFSASPSMLSGKLNWRISTPDGGFFTRSAVQNFVQDPQQPGVLYNHGNEFLHYQDDWYILAAKTNGEPDDYVFVYYRGKNDAWDGYGGAVVYTRSKILPSSIIPELQQAAKRVKLDFNKFTPTDNTCGPEPPLFARLEKKVEEGERFVVQEVEDIEKQVEDAGKAELSLFEQLTKVFRRDEERFFEELGDEEKALLASLKMEAADLGKLFGNAIPLRNLR